MSIVIDTDEVALHHGDCIEVMRAMPDASVDAVVTDPPYGLANTDPAHVADTIIRWVNGERDYLPGGAGFMGKAWDAFVPPVAVWDECLRVLKPGGYVLAFAGTRTVDLMTLGLRLAGFDIRDSIAWMYGSGFPKSMDVSKAIDKQAEGDMRRAKLAHFIAERGVDAAWLIAQGVADSKSLTDWTVEGHVPSDRNWVKIRDALGVTAAEEAVFEREVVGQRTTGLGTGRGAVPFIADSANRDLTASATDAAREWEGWGTALKPAFEPVVVARKPLVGTVAQNVLAHGTGALNIDASRIGEADGFGGGRKGSSGFVDGYESDGFVASTKGRFPANVILDESQAAELDKQAPDTGGSGKASGPSLAGAPTSVARGKFNGVEDTPFYGDKGGASRFFYTAKADSSERPVVDGIAHPTVKPLDLMRYLVRLVTPRGGVVLEPFAGSGTTLEAAVLEGFRAIGIEREATYIPLIEKRLDKPHEVGLDLFGGAA